jgi:broad specificity phosphatase PhoE
MRRDEIQERWPAELAAWVAGDLDRAPGGEDTAVFEARLLGAVERIGRAEPHGWVLCVSHGRAVHTLATALGGRSGHVDHLTGWRVRTGPPPELLDPVALLDRKVGPAPVQDL